MRALIHSTFGDPTEVLEVAERPLPEPGPGEVRVRTVLATIEQAQAAAITDFAGVKADAARSTEALARLCDPTRIGRRLGLDV